MTKLFFSYSHADETLRNMLEKHLSGLKRQGVIETWHDRRINAGEEFVGAIDRHLENADIILLLVSADFLDSDYCYNIEMERALTRHRAGEAHIIPVILRHCDWHDTPFGKLLAVPTDGKPVTAWADHDAAFLDIVRHIKAVIQKGATDSAPPSERLAPKPRAFPVATPSHRSSNLRVRKNFSEADRDEFLDQTFSFMAEFFENSLAELESRNPSLTTRFRRIDANRFTAIIYRDGNTVSSCKIVLGGMFGKGITYSNNDRGNDNSCNENLSIESDEQEIYLKALGMRFGSQGQKSRMSMEAAAEYYWSMLMEPIQ